MAARPPEEHFDMLGYVLVLWRKKWIVLLLTLITAGTALALSFTKSDTYVSTAKVLVRPTALNPLGSVPLASTINLSTEAEIVRSQQVAEIATGEMSGDISPGAVLAATSVNYTIDTQILLISYAAGDAATAQEGAQSVAQAYLDNRRQQAVEAADKAVADASTQISQLKSQANEAAKAAAEAPDGSAAQIEATNRAQQLNGQIAIWESSIASLNTQAVDPGEILVAAGLSSEPASPNHKKDAARGLLLGLLIGISAALFIDATQRRAKRAR